MSDPSAVPTGAPFPESEVFRCVRGAAEAGSALIIMVGDLDLAAAAYARDAIRRAQEEAGDVLCDLSYVSFLDLAGLQVLLDAAAHARQHDTRLTVANSPPVLPRILSMFRLQDCIELEGDHGSAAPLSQDGPVAPDEQREQKRTMRRAPATRAHGDREITHSPRRRRDH